MNKLLIVEKRTLLNATKSYEQPRPRKIKKLQTEIDEFRNRLGVSSPGTILYQSRNSDDTLVLVEADGFGGAKTLVVEGNYPIDYFTRFEKSFQREREAEDTAEDLAGVA